MIVADDGQVLQGGNEENFCRLHVQTKTSARTCFFSLYSNISKVDGDGDDVAS